MEPAVTQLLTAPNFMQLATINPDGSPHIDTVWFGYEEKRIIVATTGKTKKGRNILRNPDSFAVVTHRQNPYEQAQLKLKLAEIQDDKDLVVCDRLAAHYTGKPFPSRHFTQRVALYFDILDVHYHIAKV